MAKSIAISGKGGAGKSTLAGMIIRSLMNQTAKGVLAVDADPNFCLGQICGIEPEVTIAEIREQTRDKEPSNAGVDRVRSLEYGIAQAITEGKGFDLLTMGRPEGPSCYCAVNNLLRKFMDELSKGYEFVVMDNEAGMEHLSRRTTNNVDILFIVAEETAIGINSAQRIFELTKKLPIQIKETGVIWNKANGTKKIEGIETFGCVPYDETVVNNSMEGKTIFELEESSTALLAMQEILKRKLEN